MKSCQSTADDILRLAAESQMKRVTMIKHLGLHINDRGEVPHESNIAPIERAMNRIADTFTTVSSTPLGRSIYAKYLLASRSSMKLSVLGTWVPGAGAKKYKIHSF